VFGAKHRPEAPDRQGVWRLARTQAKRDCRGYLSAASGLTCIGTASDGEAFGLRREESIKIRPAWADQGNVLRLKDSWTKGGRYREIPIGTAVQRAVLNEAKRLASVGSLIPAETNYRDQLKAFRAECERVGINGVHGLRHRYAQERYLQKTGWHCLSGNPTH